jgi:hypothetical protein
LLQLLQSAYAKARAIAQEFGAASKTSCFPAGCRDDAENTPAQS